MKKIFMMLLCAMMVLTTGCSNTTEDNKQPSAPVIEADETKTADIIVVGAGGAGLAAAIEAVENGAQSVIIVEKTAKTGGSLNYTSGSMSGAETNIQAIDGITDSKESYVQDILKNGAYKGNEELIRAYVEEDVAAVQWLWDNGLSDNKFSVDRATGAMNVFAPEHALYSVQRTFKPSPDDAANYKSAAHEILDTVIKTVEEVTIDFNTEATELVMNEKGQVLTVVAKCDGKVIRYDAAKAVIMATGGYSGNGKMMGEYAEYGEYYLVGGSSAADGYGIYMMQQVGANIDEESMSYIPTFPMGQETAPGNGQIAPSYMWKTGAICVNQEGFRFVDETSDSVEERELALEEQTNAIQYDIFTDNVIADAEATGASVFWTYYYAPGKMLNGKVISATSLEELAGKLNINYENLQATVDSYNDHVESGETDEFGRQFTEESLNPSYNVAINKIEGENYYAIPLKALCVMTLGGVDINTNAQVLDTNGNVIPGLYAAGECTNVWGRFVSGGTGVMGPIVFGRLAGRHAATNEPAADYTAATPLTVIDPVVFEKEQAAGDEYVMPENLTDGEYTATVDGQEGPMTVKTTITGGKITAVELVEVHESSFTADAQASVSAAIVENNTVNVETVSGATLTSNRIKDAVKACLEEASK